TLTDPKSLGALDLRLKLAGNSLANLYPLTGVTLPDSPPYSTDGRLIAKLHEPDGAQFRYEGFNGKIGDSDIHGNLAYIASQP
ncbi:AsmA family protein, partial [Pseudomonas sp. SAICEU22]